MGVYVEVLHLSKRLFCTGTALWGYFFFSLSHHSSWNKRAKTKCLTEIYHRDSTLEYLHICTKYPSGLVNDATICVYLFSWLSIKIAYKRIMHNRVDFLLYYHLWCPTGNISKIKPKRTWYHKNQPLHKQTQSIIIQRGYLFINLHLILHKFSPHRERRLSTFKYLSVSTCINEIVW